MNAEVIHTFSVVVKCISIYKSIIDEEPNRNRKMMKGKKKKRSELKKEKGGGDEATLNRVTIDDVTVTS
ncbi:Endoribonuclease Dicer [Armadillidium nasatum]|uniref:Endoribonuclease Dicer n=1 Tax=Armadillidium nasatum TaxID=96803 RepID=A0A5N5SQ72_9CRUS|nr:Endoribonuclease Dicer [Armadillidium nasatum]